MEHGWYKVLFLVGEEDSGLWLSGHISLSVANGLNHCG